MRNTLILVGIGVLVVGGALFSFMSGTSGGAAKTVVASARGTLATYTPPSRTPPPGMKEYRSDPYRFSIFVPEGMTITERNKGEGASTITFEDVENEVGFEIFVVPYLEEQVSAERFRQDIPSGVRDGTKDVAIDGALGATFFSEHMGLGRTAEIWFVREGYLYEVMTIQPLSSWLEGIMAHWKFL